MASTIQLKRGSGAPTAGDLAQGEPALDLTNKRLYTEDSGGSVIEVGTNPSSLSIAGTAVTATANELNYVDGVTSNVQTQLDGKASSASPTFTGTVSVSDLDIYSDGSNSVIKEDGTGSLLIRGTSLSLQASDNATYIQCLDEGAVTLYHNASPKLATSATGVNINGNLLTNTITISGTASLGDNVKAVFGTGSDLEIFHDGTNSIISDNGTGTLKLRQGLSDRLSLSVGGVTVHGEVTAVTGDFGSTETGTLRIETSDTPNAGSVGTAGQITWDSDYLYVCVGLNSWKRIALTTISGGGA